MNFLLSGALILLTGVALGAFGAHGLKEILAPDMLAVYQTAVDYQMWHGLGLLILAALARQHNDSCYLNRAGWALTAGVLLFSGSLYLLAVTEIKALGMITPFGGLAFLAGWVLVAWHGWSLRKSR